MIGAKRAPLFQQVAFKKTQVAGAFQNTHGIAYTTAIKYA